ncbi:MAG: hypothetical protein ACI4HL_00585 [Ruminococcus sp.]
MKKMISFLLTIAVVMSFSTIMMTSSAAESVGATTDTNASGTTGKVYFEKPSMWTGEYFYVHIWENETGTSFYGWQTKKEKMTEENGKFSYDLSILDDASAEIEGGIKSGVYYSIMFSDSDGNETCGLMFTTECIGDTAYVTALDKTYENTEDSTKHSYLIAWKANGKKYGVPLQITSVGTIQGQFVTPDKTPAKIIDDWDKAYPSYPNKDSYSPQSSARDHATRLDEIKREINNMITAGQIYYVGGGVYKEIIPVVEKKPTLLRMSLSMKAGTSQTVGIINGKAKAWATSNKKVATVKNGKITALNKGTVSITVTLTTGEKLSCKVKVSTAPKLSKTTVNVKKNGTATVKLSGKVSSISNKYTNTKVAKITSKTKATTLKIKGLKKGTTTLKIKVNGVKTLSLKVKVK